MAKSRGGSDMREVGVVNPSQPESSGEEGVETVEISVSDRQRLQRMKAHLRHFTEDMQFFINPGQKMNGPIRKAAAKSKCQFIGDAKTWSPLALIQQVLEIAEESVTDG